VHALRALLNESITGFETDEAFYRHVFQSRPNLNAKLDTEKQLFCFLGDHENADASDVMVEQDRFLVKETSSTPLLLFGSEREGKHCFYRTLRRKVFFAFFLCLVSSSSSFQGSTFGAGFKFGHVSFAIEAR
jgi:hypothetical protein